LYRIRRKRHPACGALARGFVIRAAKIANGGGSFPRTVLDGPARSRMVQNRYRKQVSMASTMARGVFVTLSLLGLAACGSSLGGGSSPPPQSNVLVLPPGATIVCSNGQPPPCH
jgi:hypothetical protein